MSRFTIYIMLRPQLYLVLRRVYSTGSRGSKYKVTVPAVSNRSLNVRFRIRYL